MIRILYTLVSVILSSALMAQDRPNTILVLDGSGSMWGQIDGIAKITIAQQVVGNVLRGFPQDQGLGLTVYGHRQRGSCGDIQTIVPPGTGTAAPIMQAVQAIRPLGKTPMADAIYAAAEALRYTEEAATVILVSDGVETCNPNPCNTVRLLDELAIDFTAHVIGFDVTDPDTVAQLRCIADATGGQFLAAQDAGQLDQAMSAILLEPATSPTSVTLEARVGDLGGGLVQGAVIWEVEGHGGRIFAATQGNPITQPMGFGEYVARATRIADGAMALSRFRIESSAPASVQVHFTPLQAAATLTAAPWAQVGETVAVGWTGPNGARDYIAIGPVGADHYNGYTYTSAGTPLGLQMPAAPGLYEIRYTQGDDGTVLARQEIKVGPA